MAEIRPFVCVRPAEELASRVAALPYDVYNRQEAKEEVEAAKKEAEETVPLPPGSLLSSRSPCPFPAIFV